MSPPCQSVSQANRQVTGGQRKDALSLIRWALELVSDAKPTTWSLEQVGTPQVRKLLDEYVAKRPKTYAYTIVLCSALGVPQDRRRLVAGSPALIAKLHRVSSPPTVAGYWRSLGLTLPAQHIMNHTTNTPDRRGGYRALLPSEHMRSVDKPCYTICASNAPSWVAADGKLKRKLTPRECAHIQTFPPHYDLGGCHQQKHVGNAMPVELARRLMAK